jgi:hypothetical protein
MLAFFQALDDELVKHAKPGQRLELFHIGRSALILHYNLALGTKDVDVIEMRESELETKARELFGKESEKATALGLYLDLVPQALPPVPQHFRKRCQEVPASWKVIRLWRLENHDAAATKLKSFRAQDRQDLQFMCDEGLLNPSALRESLNSAFLWSEEDHPDRDRAFANLQVVVDYIEGRKSSL